MLFLTIHQDTRKNPEGPVNCPYSVRGTFERGEPRPNAPGVRHHFGCPQKHLEVYRFTAKIGGDRAETVNHRKSCIHAYRSTIGSDEKYEIPKVTHKKPINHKYTNQSKKST